MRDICNILLENNEALTPWAKRRLVRFNNCLLEFSLESDDLLGYAQFDGADVTGVEALVCPVPCPLQKSVCVVT